MKKVVMGIAGLVALGIAAPASAADLAARPYTKAAPMMAAMYDWSGFYVGLNGGGGWSRQCVDVIAPTAVVGPSGCHDATGGTVGGQIGYRWQAASWVFGLEAQGNWADFRGSNASILPGFAGVTNDTRVGAFGLFTGQVGYAWNNALLYAKGGAAVTDDRYRAVATVGGAALTNTISDTRWGAVVGAGVEYGFAPNWSVAFEYDHIFTDRRNYNFTVVGTAAAFGSASIRQDVDLVTARVNYRWGGPVVAKY